MFRHCIPSFFEISKYWMSAFRSYKAFDFKIHLMGSRYILSMYIYLIQLLGSWDESLIGTMLIQYAEICILHFRSSDLLKSFKFCD